MASLAVENTKDLSLNLVTGEISPLTLLLLSLLPVGNVEGGVFTRITMTSMTSQWYLRLSHFEAILVGLVVLQIFVLNYLTILPLDISKLIDNGTLLATSYTGSRKKRSSISCKRVVEDQRLAETMFSILRRLDENDCVLRTLCELEANSNGDTHYSKGISLLLSSLKRLGLKRMFREAQLVPNNITIVERKVLSEFEDAVLFNSVNVNDKFENNCGRTKTNYVKSCAVQYSLCNLEKEDLLHYVRKIEPFLL